MLDELTARDLRILMSAFSLNPWGERRADLRGAVNASFLAAAFTGATIEKEHINSLADYLVNPSVDEYISPEAAALIARTAK